MALVLFGHCQTSRKGSLLNGLVALASLILVLDDVLLLELTHALDLVQVNYEAFVVSMQRLDALSTKDIQVIGAIEVLDALRVSFA
jgi:hypothetical protein